MKVANVRAGEPSAAAGTAGLCAAQRTPEPPQMHGVILKPRGTMVLHGAGPARGDPQAARMRCNPGLGEGGGAAPGSSVDPVARTAGAVTATDCA